MFIVCTLCILPVVFIPYEEGKRGGADSFYRGYPVY